MASESNISYNGPKLLPQKTCNDFLNDEVPPYFVSRVELLQRLGRLLFHFIPENRPEGNNSSKEIEQARSISLDRNVEKHRIDVRISTSGKKIVLTESVDFFFKAWQGCSQKGTQKAIHSRPSLSYSCHRLA